MIRLLLTSFVFMGLVAAAKMEVIGAESPNVLFIAVDDLNNWISPLKGHPQCKTPNIDRLVRKGVLFTNCHCAAPACNPSRVAIMTGRRPSTSGIYFNSTPWQPALESMTTLPQHFQKNGYYALGSGKIYHGGHAPSWDEYAPSKTKHTFPKDFAFPGNVNGLKKSHFDWSPIPQKPEQMPDSKTVDYVIEQLNKSWDQPFFLACGIYRPHLPWYVPQEFFDQYPLESIVLPEVLENDLEDIPKAGVRMARPEGDHAAVTAAGEWKKAVQGYLASIAFADQMIGRVLDAYESSPNRENTIIVFWTDHGWNLGEKEHWRKFALWQDTTNVPLVFVLPDGTQAGSRCEIPCNLVDVYPTLIDLCELSKGEKLEGDSLKPWIEKPNRKGKRYSITTHGPNNHAVQSDRYRYIQYYDGSEELYDHKTDPNEWTNLVEKPEMNAVIETLRAELPRINVEEIKEGKNQQKKKQQSGKKSK